VRVAVVLLCVFPVQPHALTQSAQPSATDLFNLYLQKRFDQFSGQLALVGNFGDLRKDVGRVGREWPAEATAAFLLEASDAASRSNARPARSGPEIDLFEDACKIVRQLPPGGEFEAAWHAAALSALSAPYVLAYRIDGHLGHIRGRHDEGHVALIRAMPDERNSWREATRVQPTLAGPAQTNMYFEQRRRLGRAAMRDAVKLLEDASRHEDVRAEATLRQAGLLSLWDFHDEALPLLETASGLTEDPWLCYLMRVFAGRSLEALGRTAEAQSAYQEAVNLRAGGRTARLALASIVFSAGRHEQADRLVAEALSPSAQDSDPWVEFPNGDFRFFDARRTTLRERIQ
jgi:tetratricopeptide (TPR) repeat protein